jgi:hypothetical protein
MHRTGEILIIALIGACLALVCRGLDRAMARYDQAMAAQTATLPR